MKLNRFQSYELSSIKEMEISDLQTLNSVEILPEESSNSCLKSSKSKNRPKVPFFSNDFNTHLESCADPDKDPSMRCLNSGSLPGTSINSKVFNLKLYGKSFERKLSRL